MSGPKIIMTTVLTTITVIVFTGVFAASVLPMGAIAHGPGFGASHFRGHRFAGHSGRTLSDRCERLGADHTRVVGAVASAYLDLSNDQEVALQPVLAALDSWRADSAELCLQLANNAEHDVDTGLVAMEAFLTRSASALAEIRPAYRSFESSLNAEQRATIEAMIDRHHGKAEG